MRWMQSEHLAKGKMVYVGYVDSFCQNITRKVLERFVRKEEWHLFWLGLW